MRAALFVFPDVTELDSIGLFDPLARMAGTGIDPTFSVHRIGTDREVRGHFGATLRAEAVMPRLDPFDWLLIPGAYGTRAPQRDEEVMDYLRRWGPDRPLATVCTDALLAATARFLRGKRATTHRAAFGELEAHGVEAVEQRIVEDGRVITSAGVTAAIDLGLFLVGKLAGTTARAAIARQMEYRGDAGTGS